MRKHAIAVAAAVSLFLAGTAHATLLPECCACIPGEKATTSGERPTPTTNAAFCAEAESDETRELGARCAQQNDDHVLVCFPNIPGPSCVAQLAADNIICPASGAPAAGPLTLAALAAALSLLGAVAVSRRRHAHRRVGGTR